MEDYINSFKEEVLKTFSSLDYQNKNIYSDYLAQTYFYVKHSVPLLHLAYPFCENEKIKQAYISHIQEEGGHENLAKNDLRRLNSLAPKNFEEKINTKILYHVGYKSVVNNPVSFVGYIAALEFTAIWFFPEWVKKLEELYGEKTISFVHEHGVLDMEHTETMLELCRSMTDADLEETKKVCKETFDAYLNIIRNLEDQHSNKFAS